MRLPVWVSVVAFVAVEAALLLTIRDGLILNIVMLLHRSRDQGVADGRVALLAVLSGAHGWSVSHQHLGPGARPRRYMSYTV